MGDTLTGSKLPRAEVCPASFALPAVHQEASTAAVAGNEIHAQLEAIVRGMDGGPVVISPTWLIALVQELTEGATAIYAERCLAWNPDTGEGRDLGTHGRDYSGIRTGEIPCTVDLLIIRGTDDSVVYDYKSGYQHVSVETAQLSHQALAAVGAFALDGISTAIVKLDVEAKTYETYGRHLDVFALAAEAQRIRAIRAGVKNARSLPVAQLDVRESDDGCRYCPCWDSCPAKTKAITTLAAHLDLARPGVEIVFSDEQAGLVYEGIEAIEAAIAVAKAKLKELAKRRPIPLRGGRAVWAVEVQKETVADIDKALDALAASYPRAEAEALVEVKRTLTKGDIQTFVKSKTDRKRAPKGDDPGSPGKDAVAAAVVEKLRAANAMKSTTHFELKVKELSNV